MNHERFQKCKREVDVAVENGLGTREKVRRPILRLFFNWFQLYVRFRVQANRQLTADEKKERKKDRKTKSALSFLILGHSECCVFEGETEGKFLLKQKEVQQWKRRISMVTD